MPSRALLALPLLLSCLPAQKVPAVGAADCRRQLSSSVPSEVAWGAFHVAEQREWLLLPDLRRVLRRLATEPDYLAATERWKVEVAVLDALVQVGAKLSARELAPWVERETFTVILARKNPEQYAGLLLGLVERGRGDAAWVASCNLLLGAAPSMLAPALLPFVEVQWSITVSDLEFQTWTSSCGVSCCRGSRVVPDDGFPPFPVYTLRFGNRGKNLIADGPRRVSFTRETVAIPCGNTASGSIGSRSGYALMSLRNLAPDAPCAYVLQPSVDDLFEWRGAKVLQAEVAAKRDELVGEYRELLLALARKGHVSTLRAKSEPLRIRLDVDDARSEPPEALPDLQALVARQR